MIAAMPRLRPPHLHPQRTRHGKLVWYVRRGKGPRTRIHANFGTPEFEEEYQAALAGAPRKLKTRPSSGSLAWLWDRFRETAHWTDLKASTRRQRENIMLKVLAKSGQEPCDAITGDDILAGRDKRSAAPSQAKGFLVVMRALYRWAKEAGHVKTDPTLGIKAFPRRRTVGFPIWTEDEVDRYQNYWPIGTKERVWIDVLLYTGLRRGDAVQLGRQHVRNGVATLWTEKSQGTLAVTLPILPILAKTIAAGPCGDLAFICGGRGQPLKKESFGNLFREACNKAGIHGKSAHGLRKVGATRAADNGASEQQLNSIFGWETGSGMAKVYTEAANRKRAAMKAMVLMERTAEEQSIPSPDDEVRDAG